MINGIAGQRLLCSAVDNRRHSQPVPREPAKRAGQVSRQVSLVWGLGPTGARRAVSVVASQLHQK